ncbi:hypothetical protein KKF84_03190 [Myxococcota bacterium]|nr:hypothetical protein [Myxococcota bacterium]MBU1534295.1 hypothetical protein [Myxococcota bacterium]
MGDRPSWKEIDKMRDGAGGPQRGTKRAKNEDRQSRSSKAELDRLFSSGKLGAYVKSREEDLKIESEADSTLIVQAKKALRIEDDKKFLKEAEQIIRSSGVPGDFDFLERALALKALDLVTMVMNKILEMLRESYRPDRSRALKVQIKMVPIKFGEPDLEDISRQIIALL